MLNKPIHTGAEATLKVFEIFPRLVREFGFHSCIPNHRDFTEFDL
ncbi:hypothetical protein [Helicobacter pylori]|nr:hypothetical protein [Helicobacter pylori]